jgi:predicted exporter
LLAIMLLLWFSFASFRPLLLALTVLVCASASGLAALLWFYPQPHVLALVFATTLIGIAIDYSFHGMLAANRGVSYFQRMLPSLALGLLTTIIGYLLLTLLPFTVLNQVAVFICAGLLAAYLTVRLVFQRWLPQHSMPTQPKMLAWCQALSRRYLRVNRRATLIFCLVASALTSAALLSQAQFISDVRLFNQSPPQLLAQEQHVRALSSQTWDSRFIVVLADDTEQLLQREQQLISTLARWHDEGKLRGWQAVSQQLPSLQQQDELQQLLQHAYQSAPVQAYLAQLQLPAPAPLRQRALADVLLPPMNLQLLELETQRASVILLRGNTLSATDQAQLAASDVYWLDPIADTNHSVAQLNAQLRLWLGIAFAVALLLLLWRRGAAAAFSIAIMLLIALGGSLLISQLLQHHLNIFNLIGALLVLALALDYGVFFTSDLPHDEVVQAVLLSSCTSSLAFGLLSFSQTPAVASFGLTVFLGVALAAILSPLLNVIAVQELKIRGTV